MDAVQSKDLVVKLLEFQNEAVAKNGNEKCPEDHPRIKILFTFPVIPVDDKEDDIITGSFKKLNRHPGKILAELLKNHTPAAVGRDTYDL